MADHIRLYILLQNLTRTELIAFKHCMYNNATETPYTKVNMHTDETDIWYHLGLLTRYTLLMLMLLVYQLE